jgi:MFS family permease
MARGDDLPTVYLGERSARLQPDLGQGRREDLLAVVTMLCFTASGLAISLMAVISTDLQRGFGLSAAEIGLLTSSFMLAYGLVPVPSGLAAGRYGGRVLAVSAVLLIAGSLVFAASSSLAGFAAGRVLQGLGCGMIIPCCSPVLAQAVRPERLNRAWGFLGAGWGIGTVAALVVFPPVAQAAGFRAVLLVLAGIIAAVALVASLQPAVRALPPRDHRTTSARDVGDALARASRNRDVNLLGLFNAAGLAVGVGVLVWTPTFLTQEFGAGRDLAAALTAGLGVAALVGNPVGAAASARWGKRPIIALSLVVIGLATLALPLSPGLLVAFVLVLVSGFFTMFYFAPMFSLVPEVVDLRTVGAATGYMNMLGFAGSLLAPWLVGVLLDTGGGFTAGFLLLAAMGGLPAIGVLFLRGGRVNEAP